MAIKWSIKQLYYEISKDSKSNVVTSVHWNANDSKEVSKDGVKEAHGNPIFKKGIIDTTFTNAGWSLSDHGYIGWAGLGGSMCQWNPEFEIGFGYAMNNLELALHSRASELKIATIECIQNLK